MIVNCLLTMKWQWTYSVPVIIIVSPAFALSIAFCIVGFDIWLYAEPSTVIVDASLLDFRLFFSSFMFSLEISSSSFSKLDSKSVSNLEFSNSLDTYLSFWSFEFISSLMSVAMVFISPLSTVLLSILMSSLAATAPALIIVRSNSKEINISFLFFIFSPFF